MRRSLPALLASLLIAGALLAPPRAAAASAYEVRAWEGCAGGYNSGGFDDAGRTWVPCGNPTSLGAYDPSGRPVEQVDLEVFVTDVAPTPDGRYLYLAGPSGPMRLARDTGGVWRRDAWTPARYAMDGSSYAPGGMFVATDAVGGVYYADGAWAPNGTHTVVKYDAAGRVVARFGAYANSWATGTFYWMLTGVAVNRDGRTAYTTEVGNNRIQVWQQGAGGGYAAARAFGGTAANNADRGGYCDYAGWRGAFAAPYDVALDGAGSVYVINTTCKQVLRFAPGLGALEANIDVRVPGGDYPRPHGFTVAQDGTVLVGENLRVAVPAGSPSVSAPPVRGAGPVPPPAPPSPAAPLLQPGSAAPAAPAPTGAAATATRDVPIRALLARPRLVGPSARRSLALRVGCGRACTVTVEVRARGVLVGRAVRRVAGSGTAEVRVRLGARRAPGAAYVRVVGRVPTATAVVVRRLQLGR